MRAWDEFVKQQESNLGTVTAEKWLRSLQVVHFDAVNLYIEAKDAFHRSWFEEHIRPLTKSLVNNNGRPISVHVRTAGEMPPQKKMKMQKTNGFTLTFSDPDPKTTLDQFIFPRSEHILKELSTALIHPEHSLFSEEEIQAFNPLYIFGEEGSGKTHLLLGIYHGMKELGFNAVYETATRFTEHVVSAIQAAQMDTFRDAYRKADVLLLDDVHYFARKSATQEELFHTFNALHLSGRRIILSANCPPSGLSEIEPRLVSRFEWGITLPLPPLNDEERLHVLIKKMEQHNFPLHKSVQTMFLETFNQSTKTLVCALQALILRLHMKKSAVPVTSTMLNPQLVRHYLSDLIEEEQTARLSFDKIIQASAKYFGIRVDDILGTSKARECSLPRHLGIYLCRTALQLPLIQIGQLFKRDHTTILSSIRVVEKGMREKKSALLDPLIEISKILNLNK